MERLNNLFYYFQFLKLYKIVLFLKERVSFNVYSYECKFNGMLLDLIEYMDSRRNMFGYKEVIELKVKNLYEVQ